jgi:hypothetical protein
VLDSLRTWANKRERITVYPSATLFEFLSAADLADAVARGLPATPVTDRLALVVSEAGIDFRHFRLMGSRDYALPPDRCVAVGADGVTLEVDLGRSDLLVETELLRFAEPVERPARPAADKAGTRTYRLTAQSLAAARAGGLSIRALDDWFVTRSGQPLAPAARLLLAGPLVQGLELRPCLVLTVPTAEVADGLLQLPETAALIDARLGPTALVVAETNAVVLRQRLAELGIKLDC